MARCEHDAVMAGANNEMMFLNIKALNEWDSKVSEENDLYSYEHRETGHNHTCLLINMWDRSRHPTYMWYFFNGGIFLHCFYNEMICNIFRGCEKTARHRTDNRKRPISML